MVIDEQTTITISISLLSTLLSLAGSWGVWKARIKAAEDAIKELKENQKNTDQIFVRLQYFLSEVNPVKEDVGDLKKDMKQVFLNIRDGKR